MGITIPYISDNYTDRLHKLKNKQRNSDTVFKMYLAISN